MKNITEYLEQINESSNFKVSEFFDKDLVEKLLKQCKSLYDDGADSDLNTGMVELLSYLIEKDGNLKTGIIGACKDMIDNFK